MRNFRPETISAIENAVPIASTASALEVWKGSGNLSQQSVKMVLKDLVESGRVLRASEEYQRGKSTRKRFCYRRVSS
jgi:hypothetical protein